MNHQRSVIQAVAFLCLLCVGFCVLPTAASAQKQKQVGRLLFGKADELELFVLDAPHLYDRAGNPYVTSEGVDWPDNGVRFAALSRIAADIGLGAVPAFVPDVVHVLARGRIVRTGSKEIALDLEAQGYAQYQEEVA